MTSVLCVDDDEAVQAIISGYLQEEGYTVYGALDEASAMAAVKNYNPDIILLDLILEKTSGLNFLKNIIDDYPSTPVMMISSRGGEIDRIIGLEAGADDYLSKPFHPRELSARIKAIVKRCRKHIDDARNLNNSIRFDKWIADIKNYQIYDAETYESAHLTSKEFIVLKELIMNRNRVLSRDELFHLFRNYSDDIYDRVVDIQISRIRSKLGDESRDPKYIKTIRDVGYTFIADIKYEKSKP